MPPQSSRGTRSQLSSPRFTSTRRRRPRGCSRPRASSAGLSRRRGNRRPRYASRSRYGHSPSKCDKPGALLTAATRKALLDRPYEAVQPAEAWQDVAICASVVAVQAGPAGVIDVDNAAKAILDTMKGIVFPDDRQIEHLSVSRLRHPGSTACYLIALRAVYPALADVIDPTYQVRFAGLVTPVDG